MIKRMEDERQMELLHNNYVGHLAFIDHGGPYIIPITYYYDAKGHRIISYSSEGHKIRAMRKNPLVSLCVDEIDSVNTWRSILVHGEFEEVAGPDARHLLHKFSNGVKKVIEQKEQKQLKFISEFSSKLESEGVPIVFRIKITEITGKYRES